MVGVGDEGVVWGRDWGCVWGDGGAVAVVTEKIKCANPYETLLTLWAAFHLDSLISFIFSYNRDTTFDHHCILNTIALIVQLQGLQLFYPKLSNH